MKKYLVTYELRYRKPDGEDYGHVSQKCTVGVYDELKDAINAGNETIKELSNTFTFQDTFTDKYLFGMHRTIVTNMSFKDKMEIYIKIDTLYYYNMPDVVLEATTSVKEYAEYVKTLND